jgi:hypothetical protein
MTRVKGKRVRRVKVRGGRARESHTELCGSVYVRLWEAMGGYGRLWKKAVGGYGRLYDARG